MGRPLLLLLQLLLQLLLLFELLLHAGANNHHCDQQHRRPHGDSDEVFCHLAEQEAHLRRVLMAETQEGAGDDVQRKFGNHFLAKKQMK